MFWQYLAYFFGYNNIHLIVNKKLKIILHTYEWPDQSESRRETKSPLCGDFAVDFIFVFGYRVLKAITVRRWPFNKHAVTAVSLPHVGAVTDVKCHSNVNSRRLVGQNQNKRAGFLVSLCDVDRAARQFSQSVQSASRHLGRPSLLCSNRAPLRILFRTHTPTRHAYTDSAVLYTHTVLCCVSVRRHR